MGSRYGRNQKRRARLAFEESQAETQRWKDTSAMDRGLMQNFKRREAMHRDALAYIVETIAYHCPDSVLLPPSSRILDLDLDEMRGSFRVVLRHETTPSRFDDPSDRIQPDRRTSIELHRVRHTIERNREQLATLVHMRVEDRRGLSSSYCVSDEALAYGLHPDVRRDISERIVHELMEHFDRQRRAPARNRPSQ